MGGSVAELHADALGRGYADEKWTVAGGVTSTTYRREGLHFPRLSVLAAWGGSGVH